MDAPPSTAFPYSVQQGDSTLTFLENGQLTICAKNDKRVGSHGIWKANDPLEFVLPVTLLQIILAVTASHLFYFLLRPIRTPKFICNILGGIVLGPSALGQHLGYRFMEMLYPPRQITFIGTLSTFGASYFLFIVALKMDITRTLRASKTTWRFGIFPFITSLTAVSCLVRAYEKALNPTMKFSTMGTFFSAAMSFSNFIVISDYLMEHNLASSELGKIALSSSMLNDAMQWFTLFFVRFTKENRGVHFVQLLFCYSVLLFLCLFVIRPFLLMIAKNTPVGKPVKEVYIVCILAGVLIMAALADVLGVSYLMGPLLFGLIMPNGPPLGTTLVQKTEVVISDFLLPLFYVFVGMNTNFRELQNWTVILTLEFIIIAGYTVKVIACVIVALSYNMSLKHGVVLGLMMNVKGIAEVLTFTRMKGIQMLDEQSYAHLVFSVLLMTSIISPFIKILYKPHARLDMSTKGGEMKIRMIQECRSNSEFRMICCVYSDSNVHSTVALLEACNPNTMSPICAYVIHLTELLGISTPFFLPVDSKHRKTSLSVNYPDTYHIMRAFENYADSSNGLVSIRPYLNVAPDQQMHEAICDLAQDKSIPFIMIPFHENGAPGGHMINYIRNVSSNFQFFAPCTLGILVDRNNQMGMSLSNSQSLFHVGIFFMGGPDDREALSLGLRMVGERENMKASLFWFVVKKNKMLDENEKQETMLDEGMIDEFKAKSLENDKVVCHEIIVEDGIGVLEALRGMKEDFDLVMVGKRHCMVNFDDVESSLMENVETLGMFGDMLASAEFCDGMLPVLVTQCGGTRIGSWLNKFGSSPLLK